MTTPNPDKPDAQKKTPRTDAMTAFAGDLVYYPGLFVVDRDFARTLEKNNARLVEENGRLRTALHCAVEALESIPVSLDSPYWDYRKRAVEDARAALNPPTTGTGE